MSYFWLSSCCNHLRKKFLDKADFEAKSLYAELEGILVSNKKATKNFKIFDDAERRPLFHLYF